MLTALLSIRQELVNEIESLSDQQLNKKPSEERWSVSQVIRHLMLVEKALLPALRKAVKEESERVKEQDLKVVLDRTNKVKSPLPEPSAEFISKEELLQAWSQARSPLQEFVREVADEAVLVEKSMMHPVFGAMSIKQMIEFIGLHEQRHMEQIREIKESIG